MLLIAAGLLLIGGCSDNAPTDQNPIGSTKVTPGSTHTSSPVTTTGTGPAGASTPPPAGSTTTVTLRDTDKGRTINVKVGEPVTVTLTGTDWGFSDPKPASVLTAMSPPIVAKEPGTSSISFRAAKPGTATVTATKQSGDTFQITVIVQ